MCCQCFDAWPVQGYRIQPLASKQRWTISVDDVEAQRVLLTVVAYVNGCYAEWADPFVGACLQF